MSGTGAAVRSADPSTIAEAGALLRQGRLVAFPTETVYGLGGDATNERAVALIFAAKRRPRFNPLIVHVSDLEAAERLGRFSAAARRLAEAFWPGPLSLVLPRRGDSGLSLLVSAGLESVALRVPAHPVSQALLRAAGRPVAAPSANASGRVSPTTAQHVAEELGDAVAMILDAGPCEIGVESTVLAIEEDRASLLRHGGVPVEALRSQLPELTDRTAAADAPRSPGQSESHYAPAKPMRLNATTVAADEALLAFGAAAPTGARASCNLSGSGNLEEAAANLFRMLRSLDATDTRAIAVMPIPERGLGRAINDRLRRGAAPRGLAC